VDGVDFLRLPGGGYHRHVFERLRDLIADNADAYDLIVIDDGLSSAESVLLGQRSFLQNVIMVVERGHTAARRIAGGAQRAQPRPGEAYRGRAGRVARPCNSDTIVCAPINGGDPLVPDRV
jgi:hypothetical protein